MIYTYQIVCRYHILNWKGAIILSRSEKIVQSVKELVEEMPPDQITYAAIADKANVHWTTVRRHVGSKEDLRALINQLARESGQTNQDTRERVMDAAIQVFAQHGYAGATMDQVAKEAGQTKSVVYWHFANKCDLYLAICERNLRQQARIVPSQAEAIMQSEDRVEALSQWLYTQLAECVVSPGRPLLFFEFYTTSREPHVREKMQQLFAEFYASIAKMFESLQARGLIRQDIGAESLAIYVQTVLNGILLSWMLAPKHMELEKFANDAAQMLWSGLSGE